MKKYKVKNWKDHQHYKHRFPPWIKLEVGLLDSPKFDELSGDEVKVLIKIWLATTKNKTVGGLVHDLEKLSFMLRISKADTKMYLEKFESKGWLVECKQDASKML